MDELQILGFNGEHRWLSNFQAAPVRLDGVEYPSVENAYQAAKRPLNDRQAFRTCSAAEAKKLNKGYEVPNQFHEQKEQIMQNLVQQKFQIAGLRARLVATGNATIVEDNWWGDRFWGVCKGMGENRLGKIIMQIRNEIKKEKG